MILKIMVEWCVLLPHIHEVLSLSLNLIVAILKVFMDLSKYFGENNGTVPSIGQVLLRYPS